MSELGCWCRDADITGKCKVQPTTHTKSIDGGDCFLARSCDRLKQSLTSVSEEQCGVSIERTQLSNISPGEKCAFTTGEYQILNVAVDSKPRNDFLEPL
jgi:hypothetical protein